MTNASDQQLLAELQSGNQAAFETLFTRHYQRVFRVAYGLAQDHATADDLAQEAFLALFRQPPSLPADVPVIAWLCRVTLNRGMNLLRASRREAAHLRSLTSDEIVDPDDSLLRQEQQTQVKMLLAQLDERQARLLILRHSGLSYAEIAQTIGVAASSVGTLLARAERAFVASYQSAEPAFSNETL